MVNFSGWRQTRTSAWLAPPADAAQAPLGPCSLRATGPPLLLGSPSLRASEDYPHRAAQVSHCIGVECWFWGLVVAEKAVLTEDDRPMQFVTIEDETGLVEAGVFPKAFHCRGQGSTVREVAPTRGGLQDGVVVLRWL